MSVTLVTGGAGYIGSHTCVELLRAGRDVVVVDDLSNASPEAVRRVEALAGRPLKAFVRGDVRDRVLVRELFAEHPVDAVIHFAAKKAVGESVAQPLAYYDNNLQGLVSVLQAMDASPHSDVDNLADWLLVSDLRLGGEPPQAALAVAVEAGRIEVIEAAHPVPDDRGEQAAARLLVEVQQQLQRNSVGS